jgi:hypothetical protein
MWQSQMNAGRFLLCLLFLGTSCGKPDAVTAVVQAPSGLRMRTAPDTNSDIVAVIAHGATVTILRESGEPVTISGVQGKWTEIQFGTQRGWVFGGFLGKPVEGGDLAALLKNGGCIPFGSERGRCSFSKGAPCYEGAQLRADRTAFLGGCEAGENGTWAVSGKKITITSTMERRKACETDCWFQSYDPEKAAACETAQQCASLTGSDQKTSVIEQQSDGSFLLLPSTRMGALQQPQ